ncbi:GYF domain-containing protein [Parvularcula sp. IMCC14364]|uniref:GYF domain-containing protein n=1 Tax=Parvularcula sp. IMCC14364 TaxID=3067902 RepID=UPI0027419FCD|nr:GYF domain-containing protein [Parvularcula sp. IMCC14364]
MLSTDNWCLKVEERIYGPYTTKQLETFASEGRLSPQSQIAPAGGKVWRAAHQYPTIAELLSGEKSKSQKNFGRSNLRTQQSSLPDGAISNFIVIFDVLSGAATRLEHIIRNLGPAFRLTDNVWAVMSEQSIVGIKNTLAPHLQVREPVFVIDTKRGRSDWQNFTPEMHSKLTKSWINKVA